MVHHLFPESPSDQSSRAADGTKDNKGTNTWLCAVATFKDVNLNCVHLEYFPSSYTLGHRRLQILRP